VSLFVLPSYNNYDSISEQQAAMLETNNKQRYALTVTKCEMDSSCRSEVFPKTIKYVIASAAKKASWRRGRGSRSACKTPQIRRYRKLTDKN
jgi:hypothetical protein